LVGLDPFLTGTRVYGVLVLRTYLMIYEYVIVRSTGRKKVGAGVVLYLYVVSTPYLDSSTSAGTGGASIVGNGLSKIRILLKL
jgi:hypothetical protein